MAVASPAKNTRPPSGSRQLAAAASRPRPRQAVGSGGPAVGSPVVAAHRGDPGGPGRDERQHIGGLPGEVEAAGGRCCTPLHVADHCRTSVPASPQTARRVEQQRPLPVFDSALQAHHDHHSVAGGECRGVGQPLLPEAGLERHILPDNGSRRHGDDNGARAERGRGGPDLDGGALDVMFDRSHRLTEPDVHPGAEDRDQAGEPTADLRFALAATVDGQRHPSSLQLIGRAAGHLFPPAEGSGSGRGRKVRHGFREGPRCALEQVVHQPRRRWLMPADVDRRPAVTVLDHEQRGFGGQRNQLELRPGQQVGEYRVCGVVHHLGADLHSIVVGCRPAQDPATQPVPGLQHRHRSARGQQGLGAGQPGRSRPDHDHIDPLVMHTPEASHR